MPPLLAPPVHAPLSSRLHYCQATAAALLGALNRAVGLSGSFCLRDGGVRNGASLCCYYIKSAVVPRTKRVQDQESQEPRRPPPQCKVRPAHSAEPHSGDLRGDFPNKPSNPHCPLPVFFSTKSFFELRGRKNLARERANPTAARFASARVHAQDQRPTHRRQMAQSGASPAGCWL